MTTFTHTLRRRAGPLTLTGARQRWEIAAIAAFTIAAFALRFAQLHETLVGDEVWTYLDVVHHSLGTVMTTVNTGAENSPPLFFILSWASAKLGDPTIWIRLPSLVLGTATVPLVYLLGRETIGRLGGVIGAGVMALAPFAVFYGVEARPYATMMFFVALSTLALVRATRSSAAGWWVLYTVAAAAAAYSHYTSIFVLAVQAAWSFWLCGRRFKAPLLANLGIVLLYVPWLPNVRGKALITFSKLYPLSVGRVLSDLLRPIPGHPGLPLSAIPTVPLLIAFGLCVAAGLAALLRGFPHTRAGATRDRPLLLLSTLMLATPIGLLAYDLVATDLWLPRNLSASVPAEALVLGALLAALPRRAMMLGAAVVLLTLVVGTARMFEPAYGRGPYRSLAAYLDRSAAPRDPIALVTFQGGLAIPEQFRRPHVTTRTVPAMLRAIRPGGQGFVVLDKALARRPKLGLPRGPGFTLVSRKQYWGANATEVIVYRRVP